MIAATSPVLLFRTVRKTPAFLPAAAAFDLLADVPDDMVRTDDDDMINIFADIWDEPQAGEELHRAA